MAIQDKNPQNPVGSIVFYTDYKKYLGFLSGDEIKNLMNLLFDFVENCDFRNPQNPVGLKDATSSTQLVFEVISSQFIRDKAKYAQRAAASRENGKLGGRPSKKPKNPAKPSDNPTKPRKPVNDKGYRIKDNDIEEIITLPQDVIVNNPCAHAREEGERSFPTLEEVQSYIEWRKSPVNAQQFYETYANANPPWTDKQGHPVVDWRKLLIAWEQKYMTTYEGSADSPSSKPDKGVTSKHVL